MVKLELAQGSLPAMFAFTKRLNKQRDFVEPVYDGIESHLLQLSLSTFQLYHNLIGTERDFFDGIHASARTERLGFTPREWPKSRQALLFTLGMLHAVDSLSYVDRIVTNLGNPEMATTLYPLENDEHLRVTQGTKLFQLKGETYTKYYLRDEYRLAKFLKEQSFWNGYVHDLQHSLKIYPTSMIHKIPGIVRGHYPFGRNDLETWDTPIDSTTVLQGIKDDIVYPWYMEMISLHDGDMTIVVESPPSLKWRKRDLRRWLSQHAQLTGTFRAWAQAGSYGRIRRWSPEASSAR